MALRSVLDDVRAGRIAPLGTGEYATLDTALHAVLATMGDAPERVKTIAPFRLDECEKRLRAAHNARDYATLGLSDWGYAPWVMWTSQTRLADSPDFLDAYFAAVRNAPRRRLVRPLVYAYLRFFDGSESIVRVGRFIASELLEHIGRIGQRWLAIERDVQIFDAERGPRNVAERVLAAPEAAPSTLERYGIANDLLGGGFARAAFVQAMALYRAGAVKLAKTSDDVLHGSARALLEWAEERDAWRYAGVSKDVAEGFLMPFTAHAPPTWYGESVVPALVRLVGDPRAHPAVWVPIAQDARDLLLRYLTQSTVDSFFVAPPEATYDDPHWAERRAFWMGYYEAGAIDQAWAILGATARAKAALTDSGFGKLKNAADPKHSALIMRMGTMIAVEWSGSWRCRFFSIGPGAWSPDLYASEYDYGQISAEGTDEERYAPTTKNWQARIAFRVFRLTGIRHPKFGSGSPW